MTVVITKPRAKSIKLPAETVTAKPIKTTPCDSLALSRACAAKATEYLEHTLDLDPPDEDLSSGNTIRLARFAIRDLEMIESDDKWTDSELSETLFDVLAMIEAAIHSPHDSIAQERRQLLTSAHTLIEAAATTVFGGDDEAAPKALAAAETMEDKASHWFEIDRADGDLDSAEILLQLAHEQCVWQFSDAESSERAQERLCVLLTAIDNEVANARQKLRAAVEEMMGAPS